MGFWDCSDRIEARRAKKLEREQLDGLLVLSMLGEPGAPREQTFPRSMASVKIGREAGWADYPTPAADRNIAHRHLELRRQPSGHWLVERQGDNYVAVNGKDVEQTRVLRPGDVLTFGRDDGPKMRFDLQPAPKTGVSGALATATQKIARTAEDALCAHMRKTAAAVGGLAVLVAGFAGWTIHLERQRAAQIATLLAQVTQFATRNQQPIAGFDGNRLLMAAHVIVVSNGSGRPTAIGTAWPVSETEMVTNAHVIDEIEKLRRSFGERLEVMVRGRAASGGEATTHVVRRSGVRVHPGYALFDSFVRSGHGTLGYETMNGEFEPTPLPRGYDLAVLPLETPVDPSRVLRWRQAAEPPAPGTQLAFSGYLLEGVDGCDQNAVTPNPQLQFGYVGNVSNFFFAPSDDAPEQALLIRHSVPITGGASGGPIVDAEGFVVGVVTSGTIVPMDPARLGHVDLACVPGARQPSAALVNFAQRADLVGHLLGQRFEEERDRGFWDREATRFDDHELYLEEKYLAEANRGRIKPFRQRPAPEPPAAPAGRLALNTTPVGLQAGHDYVFMAYSQSDEPMGLFLRAGGEVLGSDSSRAPRFRFTAERDMEAELVVLSHNRNETRYSLKIFEAD